jgi:hypothetical protein
MRAPHGASADHKPIEQPLRREINDEQSWHIRLALLALLASAQQRQ